MKSIKTILGIILATAGFGGGIVATSASLSSSKETLRVNAANNIASDTNFYLEGVLGGVSSWNTDDSSRRFVAGDSKACLYWTFEAGDSFKIYNQSDNKWAGYHPNLPSNFSGNQSDNILVSKPGTYRITLNNNHRSYDDISYAWTTTSFELVSYMNVWATSDNANWISSSSSTKIGFWGTNGLYFVKSADYSFTGVDTTGLVYYKFRIPTDVSGFNFARYNSDGSTYWNATTANVSSVAANELYYIWFSSGWDNPQTSVGTAKDGSFTASAFAEAIKDIQVCNSDTKIGYGSYSKIKTNFYDKLASNQNLASVSFEDYSQSDYKGNSNSYNNLSKTVSVTALDKWNAIALSSNGANSSNIIRNNLQNKNAVFISIMAVAFVLSTCAFFFLRKKKHQ